MLCLTFYTHTYYFFPAWYAKGIYVLYAFYLIAFLILIYLVSPFDKLAGLAGHEGPRMELPQPDHGSGVPPHRPGHISNRESSVISIRIPAVENEIEFYCRKEKYELHTDQSGGFNTVRLNIYN